MNDVSVKIVTYCNRQRICGSKKLKKLEDILKENWSKFQLYFGSKKFLKKKYLNLKIWERAITSGK